MGGAVGSLIPTRGTPVCIWFWFGSRLGNLGFDFFSFLQGSACLGWVLSVLDFTTVDLSSFLQGRAWLDSASLALSFAHLGPLMLSQGYAKLGLAPLVLDFLHSDLSLPSRSFS